jgi:hypothetical protein|tara:strand:+ start:16788 stop:17141 length:354 start_codon:yes stop_codon:yes gene_type:complete
MKYIALIYSDPAAAPAFTSPEFGAFMASYQTANERYAKDGVLVIGEALKSTSTATTLRVRGGKAETMDGPFVESKEQLGGFYVFDCENLDEALKYAALIPAAQHGAVEIRPIEDYGR